MEQLIEDYPTIDVAEFIRTSEMYKLLQSTKYEDDELAKYVQRRNFPISTFDRLYSNPEFLDLAKLSVDGVTGRVTLHGDKDDFDKLATKIVKDIKTKRINTRTLNKPDDGAYQKYMGELAPLTVAGTGTSKPVSKLPTHMPKASPVRRVSPTLDVSGLYPPRAFPTIGLILDELARLRYVDFPNATFDLIRTFIEKSIKAYADGLGQEISTKNNSYVFLDAALLWLQGDIEAAGKANRQLVQVVSKLRANQKINPYSYGMTVDILNAANHNHQISIEKDDVLTVWNGVLNLLRYVLREERA